MRETDLNSIEHELRNLEESLLRPEVRRDSIACACLLADDFCEFGSSGTIFTKSQILQALKKRGAEDRSAEYRTANSFLDRRFPRPDRGSRCGTRNLSGYPKE
jgi:hypothetical protein